MTLAGIFVVAASAAPSALVGIAPVTGSAAVETKRAAERQLVESVGGLDGLDAVALSSLGAVFGPQAQAALEACADDACRAREVTALVKVRQLVLASVDREDGLTLRLRRVDVDRPETPLARVTRTTTPANVRVAVATGVAELFPEAAKRSTGVVILTGGREGARVEVDGDAAAKMAGTAVSSSPEATLRLKPGPHRIEVTYPGHFPFSTEVLVTVGPPTTVVVDLDKNRSVGPWILGGSGLVLVGAAGLAGLVAQNRADDWSGACSSAGCAPGFTRLRYEEDRNAVDTGRTVANAMLIGGGAAVLGAVLWYLFDPGSDPAPPAGSGP